MKGEIERHAEAEDEVVDVEAIKGEIETRAEADDEDVAIKGEIDEKHAEAVGGVNGEHD